MLDESKVAEAGNVLCRADRVAPRQTSGRDEFLFCERIHHLPVRGVVAQTSALGEVRGSVRGSDREPVVVVCAIGVVKLALAGRR